MAARFHPRAGAGAFGRIDGLSVRLRRCWTIVRPGRVGAPSIGATPIVRNAAIYRLVAHAVEHVSANIVLVAQARIANTSSGIAEANDVAAASHLPSFVR